MTNTTNNAASASPFVDAAGNLCFPKRATVSASDKAQTANRKALRAFVESFNNAMWIGLVGGRVHFAATDAVAGAVNRAHGGSVRSAGVLHGMRVWELSDRVGVRVDG